MAGDRTVANGLYGQIASPLGLRFCERCVVESRAKGEEPFWARSHQLPGVSVCHRHLCSLKEGTTSRSDTRATYLSLSRVIQEAHPTREIAVQASRHIVEKVAIVSHDLLVADLSSRLDDAATAFFGLLAESGWRHHNRVDALSHARVNARILERFGPDIIRDIGVDHSAYVGSSNLRSAGDSTRWIYDAMFKKGRMSNPLPFILVIIAIEASIAELTAERSTTPGTQAESERQETCCNPLCRAYDPSFRRGGQVRSSTATFETSCSTCGFVCSWSKPRPNGAGCHVLHFGALWDEALIQECRSDTMATWTMVKHFGTSKEAIMARAVNLGVWHPRWHAGHRKKAVLVGKFDEFRRIEKLEAMRAVWLRAKAASPGTGRRELGKVEPKAYKTLVRWDPEWLDRTTPKLTGRGGVKPRPPSTDDSALAERILRVFSEISARVPGTRITRRWLARELGRSSLSLSKSIYPESTKALRAVAAKAYQRGG